MAKSASSRVTTPRKIASTKPDLRLVEASADRAAAVEAAVLASAPVEAPPALKSRAGGAQQSTSARVRSLLQEARALALDQVHALETALQDAADLAREIADGGDAYPVGTREMASRLASDLPAKAEAIRAIVKRLH
ncbi:hypothetical protein [uncultured Brevundimonas sp.]|uniref:hypothetical protein n=1 Tax=uncultured Brevundimonas sp. TaxID=213418 RepID=UPI0030EC2242|tara:strand:+ start:709 stop:1116 length:408 start_codon:yes stop_codon:yes gene_type:complete